MFNNNDDIITPQEYDAYYREAVRGCVYFKSGRDRQFTNSNRKGAKRYHPPMSNEQLRVAIEAHRQANHGGEEDKACEACKRFAHEYIYKLRS